MLYYFPNQKQPKSNTIMKAKIILTGFFIVFYASNFAQINELGIKGGINFANLQGDVNENRMKIGPHLGGFINFDILEDFLLQVELLYSLQGALYKNNELNLNYKDHLHYINIPVLVKYLANEDISIHGGGYLGGFLFGKRKGTNYGTEVNQDIDNIKLLDYGVLLGLAYQLNEYLTIAARYNLGLANIYDNPEPTMVNGDGYEYEYSYDYKLHNRVLQLSVAYNILSNSNK